MGRRKLGTLSRADIGAHIAFVTTSGRHVEGTVRAFSHGIYSSPSRGQVDKPLVMVTLAPKRAEQIIVPFGSEGHWGEPDTKAEVVRRG